MTATMPLVFFFAGLGFVLFAGVLGVMVAAMIANRAESRRWRAFAARPSSGRTSGHEINLADAKRCVETAVKRFDDGAEAKQ